MAKILTSLAPSTSSPGPHCSTAGLPAITWLGLGLGLGICTVKQLALPLALPLTLPLTLTSGPTPNSTPTRHHLERLRLTHHVAQLGVALEDRVGERVGGVDDLLSVRARLRARARVRARVRAKARPRVRPRVRVGRREPSLPSLAYRVYLPSLLTESTYRT